MTPRPTVQIIDDDEAVRDSLSAFLSINGLAVETYASAEAFLAALRPEACCCVLTDHHLGGMTGLALAAWLRADGTSAPVILMTSAVAEVARQAASLPATEVLQKPFDTEALLRLIAAAIRRA